MKWPSIPQTIPLMMILFAAMATARAQTLLPDTQNEACWQNSNSLRQCVATQQQKLADQAARCTSYPEYQCLEPENTTAVSTKKVKQQKAGEKKQDMKSEKTATPNGDGLLTNSTR